MATDPKDLKDFGESLSSQAAQANAEVDKIVSGFERSVRASADLSTILEKIVLTSSELPKGVKNASDLLEKMTGKSKVFKKFEKEIADLQSKEINKALEKANYHKTISISKLKSQAAQMTLQLDVESELADKHKEVSAILKRQLELQKQTGKHQESMGESLTKSALKGYVLVKALELMSKLNPFTLIFTALKETWDFLDKKVIPSNAKINKQFGNMGAELKDIKSQAISAGVSFELLGLPFEQARDATIDFFSAMQHLPKSKKEAKELGTEALKMSEYVGLGGEAAGKLALAFQRSDSGLGALKSTMEEASVVAKKYNVFPNQLRKDMGENLDLLALFGIRNRKVFLESAAKARSYGLTIKEVDATFGKALDTMEGTSKVSATLNSIFGTNVNQLELMLEQDPTKRMEILRKELNRTGKSWDNLNKFEKNVITSTMQISEEKAQLAFASEDVRRKLEKEAKAQEKSAKVQKDWNKALGSLKSTLLPLTDLINNFLRSFSNWFSKMAGFKDSTSLVKGAAKAINDFFMNLAGYFDRKTVTGAQNIQETFQKLIKTAGSQEFADSIGKFVESVPATIAKLTPFFVEQLPMILEVVSKMASFAATVFGVSDPAEERKAQEANIREKEQAYREKGMFGTQSNLERDLETVSNMKNGQNSDIMKAVHLYHRLTQKDTAGVQRKALGEENAMNLTRFMKEKQLLDPNGQLSTRTKLIHGVQDALITKTGQVIKFDNQDNIFATKTPIKKEDVTHQNVANQQSRGWELIKVEVAPIYLDGKKISEAQVRVSRY